MASRSSLGKGLDPGLLGSVGNRLHPTLWVRILCPTQPLLQGEETRPSWDGVASCCMRTPFKPHSGGALPQNARWRQIAPWGLPPTLPSLPKHPPELPCQYTVCPHNGAAWGHGDMLFALLTLWLFGV